LNDYGPNRKRKQQDRIILIVIPHQDKVIN